MIFFKTKGNWKLKNESEPFTNLVLTSSPKLGCLTHKFYNIYCFRRCNLREFGSFEIIHYYNKDEYQKTLLENISRFLQKIGVEEKHTKYIRESLVNSKTNHVTHNTKEKAYLEKRLRSSPFLMEFIIRMFYYDYLYFNFSFPSLS